jgi:hypothetical protein
MADKAGVPKIRLTAQEVCALMYIANSRDAVEPIAMHDYAMGITIVNRESGGYTSAFRPADQNPNGGEDRGIWQINSKYHPDVTDEMAFDPVRATAAAGRISSREMDRGRFVYFKNWQAWDSSGPTIPTPVALGIATIFAALPSSEKGKAADAVVARLKKANFDIKFPKPDVNREGPLDIDPLGDIDDFFIGLGKRIFSVGFWKALGIGALGLLLILFAGFIFKGDVQETIVKGATSV